MHDKHHKQTHVLPYRSIASLFQEASSILIHTPEYEIQGTQSHYEVRKLLADKQVSHHGV